MGSFTISIFTLQDEADTLTSLPCTTAELVESRAAGVQVGQRPSRRARCTSSFCPIPYSALSTPKRPLAESNFSTSLQSNAFTTAAEAWALSVESGERFP